MARNLRQAGYGIRAWNRTRGKADALEPHGIRVANSVEEAVAGSDVTILMVSDGSTCDHLLFNKGDHGASILESALPGSQIVVMSSIPVDRARNQAKQILSHGIGYLDAPVSGGEKGAQEATLAIMAGGSEPDYAALHPVFKAMGRPTRIGPVGTGQLTKLANQLIVGNTLATVAEALIFAEQGGADPSAVRNALMGGFADSTILKQHGLRMCEKDWAPGGLSHYQLKDLRTALAQAENIGLELPVSQQVTALYEKMIACGDGNLDQSAIYREIQRLNKLES
jgi:2-hydroxy-3-oxopropionate reductase